MRVVLISENENDADEKLYFDKLCGLVEGENFSEKYVWLLGLISDYKRLADIESQYAELESDFNYYLPDFNPKNDV